MMNKQDEIQEVALTKYKSANLDRFSMDIGTGVGKSLLIIKHMQLVLHQFSMFLIVVPRKTMVENWEKEFVKHNAQHLLPHVHFTTYLSLHKLQKTFDWVYLDECHNFKSVNHFSCIENLSRKTFAVTGTYINDKEFNYSKFTLLFPKIFTYKTTQSVNEKMLNDYRIIIHKIPLSKDVRVNSYLNGYLPETQAYITVNSAVRTAEEKKQFSKLEDLRLIRMKMIQTAMSKVTYAKILSRNLTKKTIIFTESIAHADLVCTNSVHSKNSKALNEKNLNNFSLGLTQQLSTVGQLNEGINIPDLEESIILHSYANNIRSKQRIGRLLRLGAETNRTAYIHILVYKNTVDETWVKQAISDFDNSKIALYPEELTEKLLKLAKLV